MGEADLRAIIAELTEMGTPTARAYLMPQQLAVGVSGARTQAGRSYLYDTSYTCINKTVAYRSLDSQNLYPIARK